MIMGTTASVLEGVKAVVVGLNLAGLTNTQTVKQWVPRVIPDVDKLPLCVIAPAIEPPSAATRNLSHWYRFISVHVVFTASAGQTRRSATNAPVDWMDLVYEHFLKKGNLIPTVPAVDHIAVAPSSPVDLAAYDGADLWWSALTLNCRYRGNT
jgi:hypothetical protein